MYKHTRYDYDSKTDKVEILHVGRSVYAREETVQVMSDIWEQQMILTSIDNSGRLVKNAISWYGQRDGEEPEYTLDATDEAYALYEKARTDWHYQRAFDDAQQQATNPSVKGRVVKVVRGRSAKGAIGKVVAIIERQYGMGYHSVLMNKLGVATSPRMVEKVMPNGKVFQNHADMVWVWARNCEVEKPQEIDTAALREEAEKFGKAEVVKLREHVEFPYGKPYARKSA